MAPIFADDWLGVAVGVAVGAEVAVGVAVGDTVAVGVAVGTTVAVDVTVAVGVAVGATVAVGVTVDVPFDPPQAGNIDTRSPSTAIKAAHLYQKPFLNTEYLLYLNVTRYFIEHDKQFRPHRCFPFLSHLLPLLTRETVVWAMFLRFGFVSTTHPPLC